jgi:hypothetical protein
MKQIRSSKFSKFIAYYLTIMMFLQITQPMQMYALTSGPSQPEFNSFTPIGTSDMVDLASGDFSYNIPIMDVGGYPINLVYNSGVTMDQEASWVGLGWNLNIGQINRNVRGLPDDFNGDEIVTNNNLKKNVTVAVQGYVNPQIIGVLDDVPTSDASPFSAGLNLQYNNYTGYSAVPSFGLSFKLSNNVSVGMQLSSSAEDGVSVTPNVSLSTNEKEVGKKSNKFNASLSPSLTYNSRQGLSSFNLSSSINVNDGFKNGKSNESLRSGSGGISFTTPTFTPTKRQGLINNGATFGFSGGPDVFSAHVELSITGSANVQTLARKTNIDKAYGYENSENASENDLLDFNREKEQSIVSLGTLVLPITNYTYDLLSINSQAIGGQIRPFRGQVGYVYDAKVNDFSTSSSFSAELEGGGGFHGGANIRFVGSNSYTKVWNTVATNYFKEKTSDNDLNYERVYYKNVGENRIDQEYSQMFNEKLGGSYPIMLGLDLSKNATNQYYKKEFVGSNSSLTSLNNSINSQIKRENREKRNKSIQKISVNESMNYALNNNFIFNNNNAKPHHTAGYIITDENGSRHIFGETAYNLTKQEITYSTNSVGNINTGIVNYNPSEANENNHAGIDHYFNKITTPQFAHTYLISSILSSDYQDLNSDGPTDDDLGSYTKFDYLTSSNYKWRVPYKGASYNEGLKANISDQKASLLYGEKELKYINKIETKTHIAFIDLVDRSDSRGTSDISGNTFGTKMKRIKSIRLYSKAEVKNNLAVFSNPVTAATSSIKPIKTAHFEYNYSLCNGIDNNDGIDIQNGININTGGKLTLKKIYFTYRGSNMGKYTAYKFNYDLLNESNEIINNPNYNPKNYDVWANYKENNFSSSLNTPQEFPYVEQDKIQQDIWSSSWSLTSIDLPSGGKIKIGYESDDYQYVQDKKAMQMFIVEGVCGNNLGDLNNFDESSIKQELYGTSVGGQAKYIVVKVKDELSSLSQTDIINRYTNDLEGKPIYFNFFVNMTKSVNKKDFISGYFEMDGDALLGTNSTSKYLLIPMKLLHQEGKDTNDKPTNPISVASWFFARQNLHSEVFNPGFNSNRSDIVNIAKSLINSVGSFFDVFQGPNGVLKSDGCAKNFIKEKSWIRLLEPTGTKLGGGTRVKKIEMFDNWNEMLNIQSTSADIQRYKKKYGQTYDYSLDDGTSSGVATYEPNVSKENPLVMPFYHNKEKMSAQKYEETPFGESFYPSAIVTYRKVSVKNITAADDDDTIEVSKTKTGIVTTNFYTSFDFPTKSDYTTLGDISKDGASLSQNIQSSRINKRYSSNEQEVVKNLIEGMLGLNVDITNDLSLSQGFSIETNDMNGKMKAQKVFNNANELISSVSYEYSTEENNPKTLKNELTVINKDGTIENNQALGLHYDVVNDFKENYSYTNVSGIGVNTDVIPLGIIPIVLGIGIPETSEHTQILHTSVTTKIIHRTGILIKTIAFDLGSKVSTENLAWDANTGQVLLTKTVNEYDDQFYSFNYPAYWYYDRMGLATENIDLKGKLVENDDNGASFYLSQTTPGTIDLNKYFKLGDELLLSNGTKVWVSEHDNLYIKLMKSNGELIDVGDLQPEDLYFRIIRSGNRNQQMASMASITLMKNPLTSTSINHNLLAYLVPDSVTDDPKIINASAVQYSEDWASQCENNLPNRSGLKITTNSSSSPIVTSVNPYLYNLLGNWRAIKSFAYLTGRNNDNNANTRITGFYKNFIPFYKKTSSLPESNWVIDNTKWTFASEVTQYSPYGMELENKDALNRYSSAQYGYNYNLPSAVASNSRYQEMGFDGFEDYDPNFLTTPNLLKPHFGFSQSIGVNNNAAISEKTSHTGRKSIKVPSGQKTTFTRKIDACKDQN